jgi:Ca2+-binding RTX toxin-like protein
MTPRLPLTLVGNDLDNAITGNSGKNTIKAGGGNDEINGAYGNDKLYGSAGQDAFIFNSRLGSSTSDRTVNLDTVGDFSVRDDSIRLDTPFSRRSAKSES